MDDYDGYLRNTIDANDALEHKLLVAKRALENILGIAAEGTRKDPHSPAAQIYIAAHQALLTIAKAPA